MLEDHFQAVKTYQKASWTSYIHMYAGKSGYLLLEIFSIMLLSYANVSFHYFILLDFFNINSFIFSFILFFYSFRALTFLFARHKGYKIEYLQMLHKTSTYKIEYLPMLHKTSTLPLTRTIFFWHNLQCCLCMFVLLTIYLLNFLEYILH